jgi:hypothetical protein
LSAFSSRSGWLNALSQTLEEHAALLGLQDTDLEVELERDLHPSDRRDLSVELDKARTSVNRMDDDRAAEAERLSWQVVHVASIVVDLGMLPVEDIPQLPKTDEQVLSVVALILKHLQEVLDSGAIPWN